MRRLLRTGWLLGILPLGAAGCLTKGDGEKIWTDIKALQAQNSEILRSLNEHKTKLVELNESARQRTAELQKKIDQAEGILRRTNVDFFQQIQQIQAEVSKGSGRLEQLERNLDVLRRDLDSFRDETNRRLAKAATPAQPEQPALPTDPQAALDLALRELSARSYDKALDLFLSILKQWPRHPRLEDIQFGLAEAYLGKRDYKHALAEYSRFYQEFGSSERAPEALYKVAQCFEALGDYKNAMVSLKVITKKYKRSEFAKDAKKLMKTLRKRI
jgi:TolA-binding protein